MSIDKLTVPIRGAIRRYIFDGVQPGHFLTEVIQDNLFGAVAQADENSMKSLRTITQLFYNRCPSQCWGSEKKMKTWVSMSEMERAKITRNFKSDLAYL